MTLDGHRTSIALEPEFWLVLEQAAALQNVTLPQLISEIDRERLTQSPPRGLASSLRVYALAQVRAPSADA